MTEKEIVEENRIIQLNYSTENILRIANWIKSSVNMSNIATIIIREAMEIKAKGIKAGRKQFAGEILKEYKESKFSLPVGILGKLQKEVDKNGR